MKQKLFTYAVQCVILFTKASARGTTIQIQLTWGSAAGKVCVSLTHTHTHTNNCLALNMTSFHEVPD